MEVIRCVFNYKSNSRRQGVEVENTVVLLASSEVWPPVFLSHNTWETESHVCTQTPLTYTCTVCTRILDFSWYTWKERSKQEWLFFIVTQLHDYSSAVVDLESAELLLWKVFTLANVFMTRTDFILTLLLPIKELNWQSWLPICFSCPLCAAKGSSGNPMWNSLCFFKGLTR